MSSQNSGLVNRVQFESELASKLKASFKTRTRGVPEKFYHLLVTPYLTVDVYKPKDYIPPSIGIK
jgi:hypothetical protein